MISKMTGAVLCMSLCLFSTIAYSDGIVLHGFSYHAEPRKKLNGYSYNFNDRNYGLGFRKEILFFDIQAGFYKNSSLKQTRYLIVEWLPINMYDLKFGVFAGGATGYDHVSINKYPTLIPAGGIIARYGINKFDFSMRAIPPAKRTECGVISIEAAYTF